MSPARTELYIRFETCLWSSPVAIETVVKGNPGTLMNDDVWSVIIALDSSGFFFPFSSGLTENRFLRNRH